MKALTFNTAWSRSSGWARGLTIVTLAAGAWAFSGIATQANARGNDVYWSIGVNSPGVAVGVSNGPPVYYAPPPVYYAPRPIYYAPPPVYYAPPPAYYAPRPVYRSQWGPAPRWDDRRHGGHRGHRHGYR
jgi:hypothetical protein